MPIRKPEFQLLSERKVTYALTPKGLKVIHESTLQQVRGGYLEAVERLSREIGEGE